MAKAKNTRFDSWTLKRNGEVCEFEIRYNRSDNMGEEDARAMFRCTHENNPIVRAAAYDLDTLRKEILRQWDESYSIVWKPKLKVTVRREVNVPTHQYGRAVANELVLAVAEYMEGERKDGKSFHYAYTGNKNNAPTREIFAGKVPAGDKSPQRSVVNETGVFDTTVSVIDDTPENRAALNRITDALTDIGDRLLVVLNPDAIQTTLNGIGGFMLTGPLEVTGGS